MTELPRNLATFRPNGIIADRSPSDVPVEFWTGGKNMVPSEGPYMERVGGVTPRLDTPDGEAVFHSPAYDTANGVPYWCYFTLGAAGNAGLFRQSGTAGSEVNLNMPGYGAPAVGSKAIDAFSAGLLNGVPWFNRSDIAPAYWPFTGNALAHANWPAGQIAGVMWAFKNHLFCGDITDGAANYQPSLIQWTDATPALTVASAPDWGLAATSEAGSTELSEVRGRIQNGLPIRSECAIYAQNVTYLAQYIGGPFVFAFRPFSTQMGLLARHAVVEVEGRHFLMTDSDLVMHDGVRIESLADSKVRRTWFNNLDPERLNECWAGWHEQNREVWFCGATAGSEACDLAAVLDLTTLQWGFRELGEGQTAQGVKYARQGILVEGGGATWDTAAGDWDSQTGTWNDNVSLADADRFIGLERQSAGEAKTLFQQFDVSDTTYTGQLITGTLERHGLDMGKPDTIKHIRGVHVHARGESTLEVRVRGRLTESDTGTWSSWVGVDLSAVEKASLFASGRLIDVEFRSTGPVEIAGFTLEGRGGGRY